MAATSSIGTTTVRSRVGPSELSKKRAVARISDARPCSGSGIANDSAREAFTMVRRSCETLKLLKVVVFQIGDCSADIHKDLANMSLKLKFVVNGSTHLKSKAGKASVGMDQQPRMNFDKMDGDATYEGGELLHFELYKAGLLRSSRILASCAVPAVTALQSFLNDPKQKLDLELISLDSPGKVLANVSVHIGFKISTLNLVGGHQVLRTPSLKLPAEPKHVSEFRNLTNKEFQAITNFCNKANAVAKNLTAVYDASIKAMSFCWQDALRSNLCETADSNMAIASRPHNVSRSSTPAMAESDDVSTSCGNHWVVESAIGKYSTTESLEALSIPQSNQSVKVSFLPKSPQSNQFESFNQNDAFAGIMSI